MVKRYGVTEMLEYAVEEADRKLSKHINDLVYKLQVKGVTEAIIKRAIRQVLYSRIGL